MQTRLIMTIETGRLFPIILLVLSSVGLFAQEAKPDLKKSLDSGKLIYEANCQSCHMEQGDGLEGVYPPLAKSDYLMADRKRAIKQILNGASGPMKLNGKTYEGEMPGFELTDAELSDLMNYLLHSFGNKGAVVTPAEVAGVRKK